MFPREGFNLDDQLRLPENAGGTVAALGCRLENARTIRIILIGAAITGNGIVRVLFDTASNLRIDFKASDIDANGVCIGHIRGSLLAGLTQDAAYQTIAGTGSASVSRVYLELLDSPQY